MSTAQQFSGGQRLFLAGAAAALVVIAALFGCSALEVGEGARTGLQVLAVTLALFAISMLIEHLAIAPLRRMWSEGKRQLAV